MKREFNPYAMKLKEQPVPAGQQTFVDKTYLLYRGPENLGTIAVLKSGKVAATVCRTTFTTVGEAQTWLESLM